MNILRRIVEGTAKQLLKFGLWTAFCVGGVLFHLFRLLFGNLTWSTAAAIVILWGFLWYFVILEMFPGDHHKRYTKWAATLVGIFLVAITISTYFPGMTKAAQIVSQFKDQQALKNAERSTVTVGQRLDCNKTNWRNRPFFGRDRKGAVIPLIYLVQDDGRVWCLDSDIDPLGQKTQTANQALLERIKNQEPFHEPFQTPTPPPVPTATSAPTEEMTQHVTVRVVRRHWNH